MSWLLPVFLALTGPAQTGAVLADDAGIRVRVSPDTTLLRPLKDAATITVTLDGSRGGLVAPVDLSVRLTAPPSGGLVSTDFPLVEGTRLIEMNLANVPATLSWKYVFPIRGEYRLDVSGTDRQGRRFERSLAFHVRESRAKTAFLAGFVAALFLLGFIAGRVFSAPAGVAGVLILALLYAGPDRSHGTESNRTTAPKGELTVTRAQVGVPSIIRWRGIDPGTGRPVPATVTVTVMQLEKGKGIFALNGLLTDGTLDLAFQFTDASSHRVTATAVFEGRQQATEIARTVEVESVTPAFGIRAWPVLLFMFAVLAGLAAGRISKRRRISLRRTARQVKMD